MYIKILSAVGFVFAMSSIGHAQNKLTDAKAISKPNNVSITTNIAALAKPTQKVYLSYYNVSTKVRFTDSINILPTDKKVVFNTFLNEPILAQLRVVPKPSADTSVKTNAFNAANVFSIYIEPGKITVEPKDSLSNSTVKGSKSHIDYLSLNKQVDAYEAQYKTLYADYSTYRKAKDSVLAQRAENAIDSLDELVKEKVYKNYVLEHPNSPVALYAISRYAGYAMDVPKTEKLYKALTSDIQELPSGVSLAEKIELGRKLEVGQYALGFTQNDTLNNPVSLASFKGKYVLIDFWASWCGPCRAENPNVVKAYQKYKSKGFTVLGVSLDRPGQKEKWLKAIHDDQLTWTHVSDLNFWNNEVAQLYGVQAIPQNYLLDADGKIAAKNIRGEELDKTLASLLK